MEIIAKNIQFIRKKVGLNQKELANLLQLKTHHTISNWENGRVSPDIEYLIKIAELGKVTLDWLLKGEDEPQNFETNEKKEEYKVNVEKRLADLEKEMAELKQKYNYTLDQSVIISMEKLELVYKNEELQKEVEELKEKLSVRFAAAGAMGAKNKKLNS